MTEKELYRQTLERALLSGDAMKRRILRESDAENVSPAREMGCGAGNAAPRLHRRRLSRSLLYIAAALLVCIGTAMAVPSTRAAVLKILTPVVEPGDYLSTPKDERETNPAMDAAIETPDSEAYTVTIAAARDAVWQAWAEKLRLEIDELLYDGEQAYITGKLYGNAASLFRPLSEYTVTEAEGGVLHSAPDDMVFAYALYSVDGGAFGEDPTPSIVYRASDDELLQMVQNEDAVPVSISFFVGQGLKGSHTLSLRLCFYDMATLRAWDETGASDLPEPCVTLLVEDLGFDATAGTESISFLTVPAPVPLMGDALVFSGAESLNGDTAMVGNDRLSLEGGSFSLLAVRQKLEGTEFTVRIQPPAGWTKQQCHMFSNYMDVVFLVDGENQGKAYSSMKFYGPENGSRARLERILPKNAEKIDLERDIVFTISTAMQPADWDATQSFALLLVHSEMQSYNGVAVPENGRVSVPYKPNGWTEDTAARKYPDCPLYVKGGN